MYRASEYISSLYLGLKLIYRVLLAWPISHINVIRENYVMNQFYKDAPSASEIQYVLVMQ